MNHHGGSSLANQVYEHIRSGVLTGRYPAGGQLVTRKIAGELGASLNPVREAIGRLAAEGLVDHVPGAGAFVPAPAPEEILEVYEFRSAIEPFAAEKAAERITEPELEAMRGICARQHATAESLREPGSYLDAAGMEAWHATEEAFQAALIRASRNRHLDQAVRRSRILSQLFAGHRTLGLRVDLRVASRTWQVHLRLVRALARRDSVAAAECVRDALAKGATMAWEAATNAPRNGA